MQVLKAVSVAVCVLVLTAPWATAQVSGPKETPPPDYAGNQYVDSDGCVFVRASLGGEVAWIARLGSDRKPVCGHQPSLTAAAALPAPTQTAPTVAGAAAVPTPKRVAASPGVTVEKPAKRAGRVRQDGPVRLVRAGAIARSDTYCVEKFNRAQRFLLSDGRRVTACGAGEKPDPVGYLNGLGVPGLSVSPGAPSAQEIRRAERLNAGAYRVVWSNGPVKAGPEAARITAPSGAGARHVQVGAYADPANAARTQAALKHLGLPVVVLAEYKGATRIQTVLAGPFDTQDALRSALIAVHRNGYRDAFARD